MLLVSLLIGRPASFSDSAISHGQRERHMSASYGRHPASMLELKRNFLLADQDHDRAINFDEFAALLKNLEADMPLADMRIGFDEVDSDRDGLIDCREFIEWWTSD